MMMLMMTKVRPSVHRFQTKTREKMKVEKERWDVVPGGFVVYSGIG